jgi:hypothetical protein
MNPIVKNILAVLAGIIAGSVLNMGLIAVSGSVIPAPEGADTSTMESLKETMHLFEPKHFIMPFLAHALGTLLGAFVAAKIAANHKMKFSLGIGCWFLLGGTIMVVSIPSTPLWFSIVDIGLAYIPMALLGGALALKTSK